MSENNSKVHYDYGPLIAKSIAWNNKELFVGEFFGSCGVSQIYEYKFLVRSKENISDLNKDVTLQGDIGGNTIYIHGKIKAIEVKIYNDFQVQELAYLITIIPEVDQLRIQGKNRIFEDKTSMEIIKSVLDDQSITFEKKLSQEDNSKLKYCVQYHQSDWNFIENLLAQNGIYYLFENKIRGDKEKASLIFTDDLSKVSMTDSSEYKIKLIDLSDSHTVLSWSYNQQYTLTGYTSSYYDFTKSTDVNTIEGGDEGYRLEFDQITHSYPNQQTQLDAYSQYQSSSGTILNIITRSYITCGSQITVLKGDTKEKYYVIEAEYHFNTYESRKWSKGGKFIYISKLKCIPSDSSSTIPIFDKIKPKPRIYGAQTALVIGPENKETYTDQWGRVRVRFFWDKKYLDGDTTNTKDACWVRVSHAGAANNGQFYLPRIGDEVLVIFEDGDPERPLVINSLYNSTNSIPHNPTEKDINFWRMYKTGSTEDYNQFSMDANKQGSKINIDACDDFILNAGKDIKVNVEKGEIKTVNKKGKISTELTDGDLELILKKGKATYTLDKGNQKVHLKKGDLSYVLDKGKMSVELEKGNFTQTLKDGNYSNKVTKGNYKIDIENGDYALTCKKNAKTTITKNHTVQIDSKRTQTISSGDTLTIKTGNYTVTVKSGNITIESKGNLNLKGTDINISATANLNLSAPNVKISGDASTKISGAQLSMNGQASVQLESSGMMNVKGTMVNINGTMVKIN